MFSTSAAAALACAALIMRRSLSEAVMVFSGCLIAARAAALSLVHKALSNVLNCSKPKRRIKPAARFCAIHAASMAMVPLPQKGSCIGCVPL